MIEIKTTIKISDRFKLLIQGGNYEKLLLDLMNNSQSVFPNKYMHNLDQTQGECDFVDLKTGQKYDAKLLFSSEDGQLVCGKNANMGEWMSNKFSQIYEYSKYIQNQAWSEEDKLIIYQIFKSRLASLEEDEHMIAFIPYEIVLDVEGAILRYMSTDMLDTIFRKLKSDKLIGDRQIYTIYPASAGRRIVLRCLNDNRREYVADDVLREYIAFDAELS